MLRSTEIAAILTFVLATSSCGSGGNSTPDARPHSDAAVQHIIATFNPPTPGGGADWGQIPYPSDLFLDSDGQLTLTSLPTGPSPDATAVQMLTETLHLMDGAGINSHAYFPMGGDVDNASLAGNVKFVDLDNGLAEIDVDLLYRPEIGAIMAAPLLGILLEENHRYAAYVTNGVTDTDGTPIAPAPAFSEAIDLSATPSDAAIAAAQENLRPLIEALDPSVVDTLVSATVFRTQHAVEDFADMNTVVRALQPTIMGTVYYNGPDQDELDLIFGGPQEADAPPGFAYTYRRAMPHSHVAVVINASIGIPSFRSTEQFDAGYMERDEDGVPIVKSIHPVQFTLTIPKDLPSYENIPVMLFVHGINRTRADMLVFTDEVAKRGWAYAAADMLYHGDRREGAQDFNINVTWEECGRDAENNPITPCDHVGDRSGLLPATQFFHLAPSGGVPAYHPRAIMENFRQSAIDMITLNNFLADGDLTPIITELRARGVLGPEQNLSFKGDDIGILTESLGAIPSILTAAVDERVKVAFMGSPAASFPYPLLFQSAYYAATFAPIVVRPFDVADRTLLGDPIKGARNEPIVMLWNSGIERGDAAVFARYMTSGELRGDDGIDLEISESWADEYVSNSTVEHLVSLMGLPIMKITRQEDPPVLFRFVPTLEETPGPIVGNVAGGAHTQVSVLFNPMCHSLLKSLATWWEFYPDLITSPVGGAPYEARDEFYYFCDEVSAVHRYWGDFFEQHYNGEVPTATDPFPGVLPVRFPPCD